MSENILGNLPDDDLEKLARPTSQPTQAKQEEANKQAAEAQAALKERR